MSQKIRACYFCYYCMYSYSKYIAWNYHLYSHNMICNKLGHLLSLWLGLGCVCSCLLKHDASQTIRVYAHTYNMTPSVISTQTEIYRRGNVENDWNSSVARRSPSKAIIGFPIISDYFQCR